MTGLSALKFVSGKKPVSSSPQMARRQKLSNKLAEQIQLAKCEQSGTTLDLKKTRNIKDAQTGLSKRVEVPVKLKPWWWRADDGKLCITVRYGARVLEIIDGKDAIQADSIAEVISTLQVVRGAVDAGELDKRIESLSRKSKNEPVQIEKRPTLKLPTK